MGIWLGDGLKTSQTRKLPYFPVLRRPGVPLVQQASGTAWGCAARPPTIATRRQTTPVAGLQRHLTPPGKVEGTERQTTNTPPAPRGVIDLQSTRGGPGSIAEANTASVVEVHGVLEPITPRIGAKRMILLVDILGSANDIMLRLRPSGILAVDLSCRPLH